MAVFCREPIFVQEEVPTRDEMLNFANDTDSYCPLADGYACVKYVYTNRDKNNLVENITMFCGRGENISSKIKSFKI